MKKNPQCIRKKINLISLLHWLKSPLSFFHKIRDTFFIFTNNSIDLDILSMSLSPVWCNIDCSQLMSQFEHYQLQLVYPTMEHHLTRNLQHDTSQTTFDVFSQSQHLHHTLHKSFLCVSVEFSPFLK